MVRKIRHSGCKNVQFEPQHYKFKEYKKRRKAGNDVIMRTNVVGEKRLNATAVGGQNKNKEDVCQTPKIY